MTFHAFPCRSKAIYLSVQNRLRSRMLEGRSKRPRVELPGARSPHAAVAIRLVSRNIYIYRHGSPCGSNLLIASTNSPISSVSSAVSIVESKPHLSTEPSSSIAVMYASAYILIVYAVAVLAGPILSLGNGIQRTWPCPKEISDSCNSGVSLIKSRRPLPDPSFRRRLNCYVTRAVPEMR